MAFESVHESARRERLTRRAPQSSTVLVVRYGPPNVFSPAVAFSPLCFPKISSCSSPRLCASARVIFSSGFQHVGVRRRALRCPHQPFVTGTVPVPSPRRGRNSVASGVSPWTIVSPGPSKPPQGGGTTSVEIVVRVVVNAVLLQQQPKFLSERQSPVVPLLLSDICGDLIRG